MTNSPLTVNADAHASDASTKARLDGRVDPVRGPGAAPTGDLEVLLRKRLRVLGVVASAIYAWLAIYIVPYLFSNPGAFAGFRLSAGVCAAILPVLMGLTALLWTRRALSLPQLRAIEAAAFGLVLLHMAASRHEYLLYYGLAKVLQEGPPLSPPRFAAFLCLPFFGLVTAYGTLIPNTWRRGLGMIGAMALTPVALGAAAGIQAGVFSRALALSLLLPSLAMMSVAATLAVLGAHRIESLRQEALEARRLGQYQLGERLGSGGMGEVYLAEHLLLRRPCAIKLIRPDRAGDPQSLRRFEREVRATATLTNWHTVEIYDYGHTRDGTFYYVMEYLPGPNLAQLVEQQGPLPARRVIHVMRQLCSALHEAHAAGLIHRDIKPANVISCERGGLQDVVKLLDFGLVRTHRIDSATAQELTHEGMVAGTPAFMSPEQASGKDDLAAPSDLYSLGAMAYFLLTGQPPFVRETSMQVLAAHISEQVTPPAQLRAGVPEDLQAVVLRCLEKDPSRRFSSARSMDDALRRCADAPSSSSYGTLTVTLTSVVPLRHQPARFEQ
jgi:serine/threonine-protein kinase